VRDCASAATAPLPRPADSVFAASLPYCNVPLFPLPDYDAEKAALLLDAEGWALNSSDGYRYRGGQRLQVSVLVLADNDLHTAIAADVAGALAASGIQATVQPETKEVYNALVVRGAFSIAMTETWGPGYDPFSTASAWRIANEADFAAQAGMRSPMTSAQLAANITLALASNDEPTRASAWSAILTAVHAQAIYLPLSFVRNTAVVSRSVTGFEFGSLQFDIPLVQLQKGGGGGGAAPSAAPTLPPGAVAAIVVLGVVGVVGLAIVAYMARRERAGSPLFHPLLPNIIESSPAGGPSMVAAQGGRAAFTTSAATSGSSTRLGDAAVLA